MIGDEVEVTVVDIRGDKVRLGITAPKHVSIHRREVYDAVQRERRADQPYEADTMNFTGKSDAPAASAPIVSSLGVTSLTGRAAQ
jgi:carbon storage regulator